MEEAVGMLYLLCKREETFRTKVGETRVSGLAGAKTQWTEHCFNILLFRNVSNRCIGVSQWSGRVSCTNVYCVHIPFSWDGVSAHLSEMQKQWMLRWNITSGYSCTKILQVYIVGKVSRLERLACHDRSFTSQLPTATSKTLPNDLHLFHLASTLSKISIYYK